MRFTGTHRTTYTYSAPVYLQSHKIRLRPRTDPRQLLLDFSIDIDPKPDGITEALDAWGNHVTWAWFSGTTEQLDITTHFVTERIRSNPFDFIIPTAEESSLPPAYPVDERAALAPCLVADPGPEVRRLADDVALAAGGQVVDFARELTNRIHSECRRVVRPEGDPLPSEETLSNGEGSCRDLAVLYVDACRHVGIASRFVSGYLERHTPGEPRELHAWAGVYVPGAGWRGFDPTQGLAVSTGHVVLATAASPAGAAPVTGTFLGTGVTAELSSTIELDVESDGVT